MKQAPLIPARDLLLFPGVIAPIFIGRKKSIGSLQKSLLDNNQMILFMQKEKTKEKIKLPEDIYDIGLLVNIVQTVKMPDSTIKTLVEVKNRVRLLEVIENKDEISGKYENINFETVDEEQLEATKRKVITIFEKYARITNKVSPELVLNLRGIDSTSKMFDLISANLNISTQRKQELLEIFTLEDYGYKLIEVLTHEVEILELEREIDKKVKEQMTNIQKNYYLREKVKAIQEELGEKKSGDELAELKEKIEKSNLPKYAREKLEKELSRLMKMPSHSSEASLTRVYIEIILELPWNEATKDTLNIKKAKKILDEDHYGLEEVKERILEFLAVKKLNNKLSGTILCLVGPPGIGKTSLAKSIARSLGRKFSRISLGGVRDEAEIRGHRRTYIGAMPGRIIKELKHVGTNNPLILFDEIDKMATDFRGDPSSALLEVLDPEQNREFTDHYVDMPFDLSNIFFITTANNLGEIPGPLRDRLEIITLDSYTEFEKLNIAKKHLLKKSQEENGLKDYKVKVSDKALLRIINEYTREAGVRGLKRELDRIFRKGAKNILEFDKKDVIVNLKNLKSYLGNAKYRPDKMRIKEGKIGVVNGLAWTSVGGTTLEVQSIKMQGKGKLLLTGKLGDVMKESAQVAHSFVKSKAEDFKISIDCYEKSDVHLHFPEGAVPKDGPSAGITITTAIVSILSNRKVRQDIAMTGEITITGEVLPVGGIKEKVIGAHRVGIREVILPIDNEVDTEKLPSEIKKDMKFYFAKVYDDVEKIVFEK
ncbi:endopeptidase La [Haliovirga abyssi]|uniref:Lon protease n=1 Tax=Haliovirga abyssi TaxID=2996794 RepID=A0AAU9DGY4_9FUSO|nr:endopeptidase La [Haliovirga abyssi]BDU49964.1 Lon protease [Haliovirga abyssi]